MRSKNSGFKRATAVSAMWKLRSEELRDRKALLPTLPANKVTGKRCDAGSTGKEKEGYSYCSHVRRQAIGWVPLNLNLGFERALSFPKL